MILSATVHGDGKKKKGDVDIYRAKCPFTRVSHGALAISSDCLPVAFYDRLRSSAIFKSNQERDTDTRLITFRITFVIRKLCAVRRIISVTKMHETLNPSISSVTQMIF